MKKELLDHLSCPFCGGDIKIQKILQQDKSELSYGVLTCTECETRYPVIEAIPVIMPPGKRLDVFTQTRKDANLKEGKTVHELCRALENGEVEKVKESVIYSIPYWLFLRLPKSTDLLGNVGKRAIRKIVRSSYFDRMRATYVKDIFENKKTTAYEAMRVYYQEHEHFNYFYYKFGQPRFLTTLGLASIFDDQQQPVLDLACGLGHLLHFLTQKNPDRMAIGVDRNFFQLILAKKYIAPEGQYICAEADEKLPFRNDTFGGVICADAFHLFLKKVSCVRDLKKLVGNDGTIILNNFGNRRISPIVGTELTPEGYLNLFNSMQVKMVGQESLLKSYLDKRKPNLSQPSDVDQLEDQNWLSIIASDNMQVFKDYGPFNEWPHSVGKLHLNPLYKKTGSDDQGNEHYEFTFPSEWYAFEDSSWRDYAPEEVTIPKGLLQSLDGDKADPQVNKYIDNFVILGFPENYM